MYDEYITEREFTLSQLEEINKGLEQSLKQTSQNSLKSKIIGGLISGLSLWVTAPISVAVAGIIASFVFGTLSDSTTRETFERGQEELEDIELFMHRNNYEKVKVKVAICEHIDSGITFIEGAIGTGYYKNGRWILL